MRTTSLRPSGRADVTSLPQAGMGGVGWRGVGGRGAEECAGSVRRESRARHADELPIAARERRTRGDVARVEWPALVAHRQASHRGRVKMVGEGGGGRGGVPANDDGRDGKRPSSAPPSLRSVRVSLFVSPARECRPAHERGARARGPGWRERFKSGASPQRGGIASFERAGAPAHGRDIARRLASRTDEGSGPRPARVGPCLNQTKIGAQKPLGTCSASSAARESKTNSE